MNDLVWYSSLAAVALSAYWSIRKSTANSFLWTLLLVGCFLCFLIKCGLIVLPWHSGLQARGGNYVEWVLVVVLYMAMILGMLAHYAYVRFQRQRERRRKFDLGSSWPRFSSLRECFLPIASVLQAAEAVQAGASHFMLFLVAFENGFFWREFFENRLTRHTEGRE
jgi:hypothetical protein